MARFSFMLQLKGEEVIPEYERLHEDVEQEVLDAHARSGFRNYSLFRSGLQLFGYFETDDGWGAIEKLATEPIMKSWWEKTNPLMEIDEKNMPLFKELPEVFHMD